MADTKGSEFGGVQGRIQPLPHELKPSERLRLERMYVTGEVGAPADADEAREYEARVVEKRPGIANPDGFGE